MATVARSRRTSAPKADTKAEVSAKPAFTFVHKGNIHTSLKARIISKAVAAKLVAKRVATAIAKPVRTAAAKVVVTARAVVSTVTVATVRTVVSRPRALRAYFGVRLFAARLWHRAVRPLLRAMVFAIAITVAFVAIVAGLTLAPVATILIYLGVMACFFAAARGLHALEQRAATIEGMTARRVLNALDVVARIFKVLAYGAAAVTTVALCVTSWSFAVFVVLDLVLSFFEVRGATTIAFLVSCIVSGQWVLAVSWVLWRSLRGGVISDQPRIVPSDDVPAYSEIRREPVEHADVLHRDAVEVRPSDAPDAPETWTRGNHLIAKGTEEFWGTADDVPFVVHDDADEGRFVPVTHLLTCTACGEGRVNLVLSRAKPGDASVQAYVCEECYAAEDEHAEVAAIRHTGVSLKARSCEVHLNQAGIENSNAFSLSKAIASGALTVEQRASLAHLDWAEGDDIGIWMPVAWWRDRKGNPHKREWVCLYDGIEVARVRHEHRRNVFTATVLGEVANRTWNDDGAARRAANRVLRDYEISMSTKVNALQDVASDERVAAQGV